MPAYARVRREPSGSGVRGRYDKEALVGKKNSDRPHKNERKERSRSGRGSYSEHIQQHDHFVDRHSGSRDLVGQLRYSGLQGHEEGHPVCRATGCRHGGEGCHGAWDVARKAEYFLTTDGMILRKLSSYSEIKVTNPTDFIRILEEES